MGKTKRQRQRDQPPVDRYGRNQMRSRRVNAETARLNYAAISGEYVCECAMNCGLPVRLNIDEFEQIAEQPGQFVVRPGHALPSYERVVQANARYEVVTRAARA
jgi:hypothetical protein